MGKVLAYGRQSPVRGVVRKTLSCLVFNVNGKIVVEFALNICYTIAIISTEI